DHVVSLRRLKQPDDAARERPSAAEELSGPAWQLMRLPFEPIGAECPHMTRADHGCDVDMPDSTLFPLRLEPHIETRHWPLRHIDLRADLVVVNMRCAEIDDAVAIDYVRRRDLERRWIEVEFLG